LPVVRALRDRPVKKGGRAVARPPKSVKTIHLLMFLPSQSLNPNDEPPAILNRFVEPWITRPGDVSWSSSFG
jgi:hypothetical protein